MTTHHRRIKVVTFDLGTALGIECQIQNWTMNNNTDDGDKLYAQCPDGEFRDDAEPDYVLDLVLFADWRSAGITRYLTVSDGLTQTFRLDHHPDFVDEHVAWSGLAKLRAPTVNGEGRTTEMTEVSLPIIGKPTFHPTGDES